MKKKPAPQQHSQTEKADVYEMNGVRYIREDLVQRKMDSIMERIAISQEKQAAFYERWEEQMKPMIKIINKMVKSKAMNF